MQAKLTSHIDFQAKISYRNLKSKNFAQISDLLAGQSFLDVDSFSEGSEARNTLLSPNHLVGKGEKIKYHFDLNARVWGGFTQAQFNYKKFDYFLAARISHSTYQRTGYFQNGNYPQNSLGKSDLLPFSNVGVKGGVTYKISRNYLFPLHAAHFSNAPNLRNFFSNSRQNNDVVQDLKNENISAVDLNYYLRLPNIKA